MRLLEPETGYGACHAHRSQAIDTTKHTVTISHGAVPAVQWPPMTMAFSITQDQLTGLTTGDHVSFSFRLEGGKATIVSIKK
ncbi:copper-binding protein [Pseudomonas moorei]|nr:copper-binding protein [Pseudomonas moorei]